MMDPQRKRILIVDDNKIHLRLFRDILVGHGYETVETGEAEADRDSASLRRRYNPR
jgi:CheY-like chemotaxis protein